MSLFFTVSALRAYKQLRVPLAWRGGTKKQLQKESTKKLYYRFMTQTGTKGARGATTSLVPVCGTNQDQRVELVPVRATNRDQWPCIAAWWWEFSPTSLAEREPHLFIRCGAPELSSSSLKQAYGPNLSVHACGPTGPSAGLSPGPWMGF